MSTFSLFFFFFFNDTATTEIYTLSLHDALPISFLVPGFEIGAFGEERFDFLGPALFGGCQDIHRGVGRQYGESGGEKDGTEAHTTVLPMCVCGAGFQRHRGAGFQPATTAFWRR